MDIQEEAQAKGLRPIGTEFDVDYPPSMQTTEPFQSYRTRYRVVGYGRILRYQGDTIGDIGETVETISVTPLHDEVAQIAKLYNTSVIPW